MRIFNGKKIRKIHENKKFEFFFEKWRKKKWKISIKNSKKLENFPEKYFVNFQEILKHSNRRILKIFSFWKKWRKSKFWKIKKKEFEKCQRQKNWKILIKEKISSKKIRKILLKQKRNSKNLKISNKYQENRKKENSIKSNNFLKISKRINFKKF